MLKNSSILITGGTGSFGNTFVPMTLAKYNPKRLVIYSRDEMKQWDMAQKYSGDPRVVFMIGDVRDRERLARALDGIDYVVHAAATKIVFGAACLSTGLAALDRVSFSVLAVPIAHQYSLQLSEMGMLQNAMLIGYVFGQVSW
jgi:uncharacterized protein YbjT (DUF2867 family)